MSVYFSKISIFFFTVKNIVTYNGTGRPDSEIRYEVHAVIIYFNISQALLPVYIPGTMVHGTKYMYLVPSQGPGKL